MRRNRTLVGPGEGSLALCRISPVASPPRPERAAPRELAALAELAAQHPELAPAVALERELFDGERRLQRRLGTPWIDASSEQLTERLARGECLVELDHLALDWTELRLRVRQVMDVLRRHDVLEPADARRLQTLDRGAELPGAGRPLVRRRRRDDRRMAISRSMRCSAMCWGSRCGRS